MVGNKLPTIVKTIQVQYIGVLFAEPIGEILMSTVAGFVGSLIGALIITFLITRAAIKATGKTKRGALGAFIIGLAVSWIVSISSGAALYGRGPDWDALAAYTLALLVWLYRDYNRAIGNTISASAATQTSSVDSVVMQDISQVTIVISPKEKITFRFVLITWGLGLLFLVFSASSYFMAQSKQSKISELAAIDGACVDRVMKATPDCNIDFRKSDGTCGQLTAICHFGQEYFDQLVEERSDWYERSEGSLYLAFLVPLLSSIFFYVIRWGITGRIRPLWLLGSSTKERSKLL
jgi:hypothetical protein